MKARHTKHKQRMLDEMHKAVMTDVYRKIITAVNIETGDDGTKAHKILEVFHELYKMPEDKYKKQQHFYG